MSQKNLTSPTAGLETLPFERIMREKEFHNSLADQGFDSRKLINRLSWSFYSKADNSPLWGPVWSTIELVGRSVLDYGCGEGGFSLGLAHRGARVSGIDISESLVAWAIRSVPDGVPVPNFSVRDAHATGFPDNSFDYVFGNGILHHLDLPKAYAEIARVLKPGGKAFFMEPLERHPLLALVRKATPESRSIDEKPLSMANISLAQQFFATVRHNEHFLFAVAAAPIHLVSNKIAFKITNVLDRFDRMIIRACPPVWRYAWLSMLELQKSSFS